MSFRIAMPSATLIPTLGRMIRSGLCHVIYPQTPLPRHFPKELPGSHRKPPSIEQSTMPSWAALGNVIVILRLSAIEFAGWRNPLERRTQADYVPAPEQDRAAITEPASSGRACPAHWVYEQPGDEFRTVG
jgi:hypothetical protein